MFKVIRLFDFLAPSFLKIAITFLLLFTISLEGRFPLTDGSYFVSRYSPMVMMDLYLKLGEGIYFFKLVGFSFFVYTLVALIVHFVTLKKNEKK